MDEGGVAGLKDSAIQEMGNQRAGCEESSQGHIPLFLVSIIWWRPGSSPRLSRSWRRLWEAGAKYAGIISRRRLPLETIAPRDLETAPCAGETPPGSSARPRTVQNASACRSLVPTRPFVPVCWDGARNDYPLFIGTCAPQDRSHPGALV